MSTSDNLCFIHLTDPHIQAAEAEPIFNMDSHRKLMDILAMVRSLAYKPAFFVISGVLCHHGDVASYTRLKSVTDEITASFGVPVLLALGNHDERIPFRQVFLCETETDERRPYYDSTEIADLRIIVLDSRIPGDVAGILDDTQMDWFRAELDKDAPLGQLVVLHHPPKINIESDPIGHWLRNSDAFASAIVGKHVIGILSGHVHYNNINILHGALNVTTAGIAYLLGPPSINEMTFLDGAGFSVLQIGDGILTANAIPLPGEQRVAAHLEFDQIVEIVARGRRRFEEEERARRAAR